MTKITSLAFVTICSVNIIHYLVYPFLRNSSGLRGGLQGRHLLIKMGGQRLFLKVTATLNKRAKHNTERMCEDAARVITSDAQHRTAQACKGNAGTAFHPTSS